MRKLSIVVAILVLSATVAWAVKITLFADMDFYINRGKQIVIADFIAAHNTHHYEDGLYTAEVDVVRVLAGQTRVGKLRVLTIYPMTRGTRYLFYSLAGPPEFQAIPELSVVALPDGFDLSRLDGKSLREQLLLILETRRFQVGHELKERQEEQKLLDKALGKAGKP